VLGGSYVPGPVAMTGGNGLIAAGTLGRDVLKPAPFKDWAVSNAALSHEGGISQDNLAAWGAFLPASSGAYVPSCASGGGVGQWYAPFGVEVPPDGRAAFTRLSHTSCRDSWAVTCGDSSRSLPHSQE
jgi:hypothetical protein